MGLTGGRSILQVHPTRRCNLRCRHCYSESGPHVDAVLDVGTVRAVIADAADLGYDVMSVSGGEPLLHRGLEDLLHCAHEHGMRTTVTSNGMLLTPRRLAELADLVDVLAISLDGAPETHARMRGDARAFRVLDSRMAGVERSGIPFGFITTLTMRNVHELAFVVQYAAAHGASLVQVHPLEAEGAAVTNLRGEQPDGREAAFAFVEAARLSAVHRIPVQVDLAHRSELDRNPQAFLAVAPEPDVGLAGWLTPLVLQTDGQVVPLMHGFPAPYALGSVLERPLAELATCWDPAPLLRVTAAAAERIRQRAGALFNWYEVVTDVAREQCLPVAPDARKASSAVVVGRA